MKICYNCFNEIPDGTGTCPYCGSSADLRNRDKYLYALPCGSVPAGRSLSASEQFIAKRYTV